MATVTIRIRKTPIAHKNFWERIFFAPVEDRPFEARMQSQFLTFPFAS